MNDFWAILIALLVVAIPLAGFFTYFLFKKLSKGEDEKTNKNGK